MTSLHFYHAPDNSMATKTGTISSRGFTSLQPLKVTVPSLDNNLPPEMVHICLDTNSSWKMYLIKYSLSSSKSKGVGQQLLSLLLLIGGTISCLLCEMGSLTPSTLVPLLPLAQALPAGFARFPLELFCLPALSAQPSLLAHMLPKPASCCS